VFAVTLAAPFVFALSIKVTGNMLGIAADVAETSDLYRREADPLSESMRNISEEVRARRSQPGASTYTSAG
jgi:hypothetical protein